MHRKPFRISDPAELAWEMQNAWQHLEELIPADHLQAIHDLL